MAHQLGGVVRLVLAAVLLMAAVPGNAPACVQTGTPYDGLWSAARSYHPSGVQGCLADGSVRFFNNNIALLTWQALGSRGGGESLGDF